MPKPTLDKAQLELQKKLAEDINATVVAKQIALQNAQDARKYAYDEYDKAKNRPWDPDEVTEHYQKNFVEADRTLTVAQAEYEQALASQKTYAYDVALLKQDVAQAERKVAQIKAEGGTPLDGRAGQTRCEEDRGQDRGGQRQRAVRWQSAGVEHPSRQFGGGVQDGRRGRRSERVGTHRRIWKRAMWPNSAWRCRPSCGCAIGPAKT